MGAPMSTPAARLAADPREPSAPTTSTETSARPRVRVGWLGLWAFLTAFAGFEVVKHGIVTGTATDAVILAASAFVSFVAPDLTFLVGVGQPTQPGHLPRAAVPWYNAMHRISVPLALTTVVGIALAPLPLWGLALFVAGLSWMAHISLDRAAGYGLRQPDGSRNRT